MGYKTDMRPQPVRHATEVPHAGGATAPITFEFIREHPRVRLYVRTADASLEAIGYTEHGERHVGLVSRIAFNVLKRLGKPERMCELAAIAGYLHDIGNAVNRDHHAQTGATMAMQLLTDFGMPDEEILPVIAAIGNHHENDGDPVNDIAAAIILADKSDVHRTRVRNPDMIKFDIHDRDCARACGARGAQAHHARTRARPGHLAHDGVLRDLHDADARVPQGGQTSGRHVRPAGERSSARVTASTAGRAVGVPSGGRTPRAGFPPTAPPAASQGGVS